jgi:copper chaperone CopZ
MTFRVPGISCGHCVNAISGEVGQVAGVRDVVVDIPAEQVTVRGEGLDDTLLRAAIDEAGYEAEPGRGR